MKKKILLFLTVCMIFLCLVGCGDENDNNEHDMIKIYRNDCDDFFDIPEDISIKIKDGYFYYKHEKFTVDEDTIGLTIYFSKNVEDAWE